MKGERYLNRTTPQSPDWKVTEHDAGDFQKLRELTDQDRNARQRDRYRAVLLPVDDREGDEIRIR